MPVYLYTTEYGEDDRGTACIGRSGLTFRGMQGVYLNYPSATTVDVMDQTFVTQQLTFGGSNGEEMTQTLAVNDPTLAEGSWAGPTTVYEYDSQYNRSGMRLPGNPGTVGGSAYWSETATYDTGNSSQGSRGNLVTAVQHVLNSDNSTENTALEQTTNYTYDAGGHNRVIQVVRTATAILSVVNHVSQYLYDGDTSYSSSNTGWMKLKKTIRYDDSAPGTTWTQSSAYYSDTTYPGKVQTRTDGNGNQWGYAYDACGNLTSETSPGTTGRTTSFTYDTTAHVLPITRTDNNGNVWTTSYHTSGTNPDWRAKQTSLNTTGTPTNYVDWDADSRPVMRDNYISGDTASPSGNEVDDSYTDGGLATQEQQYYYSSTSEVHFFYYDAMGRMTSRGYGVSIYQNHTNGNRAIDYSYDRLGRLSSKKWDSGGYLPNETASYQYDTTTGRLSEQDNPNSTRTLMTYDSLGREVQREHQQSSGGLWTSLGKHNLAYQPDGLVAATATNQPYACVTRELTYDMLGEMGGEYKYTGYFPSSYPPNSYLVEQQTYYYDKAGNRTNWNQFDGSGSYQQGTISAFDAGNQLTQVKHYGSGDTFTYADDFTTSGSFDANGNQLKSVGGGTFAFAYHADNKLKSWSGSSQSETSYYFPNGQLSHRGTVYSQYDGDQRTQDMDSSVESWGPPTTLEYADRDLTIQYGYASGGTQPSSVTLKWSLYDGLGNVALVTDSSGSVTDAYDADLFGTNPTDKGVASAAEFQFAGEFGYSDRSTPGVAQVGARVYDPGEGRFLQQDPQSFGSGDWSYAGNSPGNAADPSGRTTGVLDPTALKKLKFIAKLAFDVGITGVGIGSGLIGSALIVDQPETATAVLFVSALAAGLGLAGLYDDWLRWNSDPDLQKQDPPLLSAIGTHILLLGAFNDEKAGNTAGAVADLRAAVGLTPPPAHL